METKQSFENIQETFLVGLNGLFRMSDFWKDLWKYRVTKYSIIFSILIPFISLVSKVDNVDLINEIQLQMIVFLPGILGFTIAGYALVVGFVQSNMLNKITEPTKDSKFSLYQIMSAKFAMNVVLQGVGLTFAYLYHFVIFFDNKNKLQIKFSNCVYFIINFAALAIISFWFIIALLLIVQIVINIFNFSQLHHYFINIQKVRDKESIDKLTDI